MSSTYVPSVRVIVAAQSECIVQGRPDGNEANCGTKCFFDYYVCMLLVAQ